MSESAATPPSAPSPTPAPAKSGSGQDDLSRRSFLKLGWAALLGFFASSAGATLRFMFPNVLYEPPDTFNAGRPEDYSMGVSNRWIKAQRVWIIRTEQGIYAMWARCTHLGCTPNWFQAENRFRCPCHGSNYTIAGDVIAGPAPKPLYRCGIHASPSGELLVDKGNLEDRPGLREKSAFFIAYTGTGTAPAKA